MLTEDECKKYQMSLNGLKHQRKILHIRMSKLESAFRKETKKIEGGLEKNNELAQELEDEMKSARTLPF